MGLRKALKKVGKVAATISTGGLNLVGGALKSPKAPDAQDPTGDINALNVYGAEEEARRQALGREQQQQILQFGNEFQNRAKDFRSQLAQRLADTGQETFKMSNPYILEDLNSRGLASSPSEVANQQAQALKEIALANQSQLTGFDQDIFNQYNDLQGTGLSALLGGNQQALDAVLEARRAGLQRSFDVADQNRSESMAKYLAKRQSRDALIGSLLGGASKVGAAYAGKPS